VLALGVSSCTQSGSEKPKPKVDAIKVAFSNSPINYQVITIDSCEYILMDGFHEMSLTHKGDCKNPIHKHHD
jgi:hypothetical protein